MISLATKQWASLRWHHQHRHGSGAGGWGQRLQFEIDQVGENVRGDVFRERTQILDRHHGFRGDGWFLGRESDCFAGTFMLVTARLCGNKGAARPGLSRNYPGPASLLGETAVEERVAA